MADDVTAGIEGGATGDVAGGVRLTVDGTEVSVAPGTNVVDAARQAGVEIPVFCHHPLLEPVGMCRMCLVEVGTPAVDRGSGDVQLDDDGRPVIRFFPQLVPGCTTVVSEGMVVRTDTAAVAEVRRSVIELLLTSHPLDCPVCDKGGECPLQNQTMRYGPGRSRFEWSDKQRFEKPVALGPLIILDRERCVLCARCIRFQDEIAEDPVLGFSSRGRGMEVISASDPPFDSRFSGNTTDICPVGALTSTDFRFAARAWELVGVPSLCAHCPVGCNVMYDIRHGRILRVMPRRNDEVNEIWLCDKGRFAHAFANADDRLVTPLIREGGELVPASWSDALAAVAEGLTSARSRGGPAAVGGIASGASPNEDLYMFGRFMRSVVGTNNVDHRPSVVRDAVPIAAGVASGTRLTDLGDGAVVVVVGLDVEEEAPVLQLNLIKARRRGARIVVIGGRPQKLDRLACHALRYRYGGEDAVLAALLRRVLSEHAQVAQVAQVADAADPAALHESVAEDAADAATLCESDAADAAALRGSNPADPDALHESVAANAADAAALHESVAADAAALRESVASFTEDVLAGVHPVRPDDLATAAEAICGATDLLIAYGRDAVAAGLTSALAALVTATGHVGRPNNGLLPVGPEANSQGAADMGLLPDLLPGYRSVTDESARMALGSAWPRVPHDEPGVEAREMIAGGVRALYAMRTDPVGDDPTTRPQLEELDFLVVQDLFLTETARCADVVLPDLSVPERDGTLTSCTRRVQRFRAAAAPIGDARPGWEILRDLGQALGVPESFESAADVTTDIAMVVPGYGGLTPDVLGPSAEQPRAGQILPFAPTTDARSVTQHGTAYDNDFGVGRTWPLPEHVGGSEDGGGEERGDRDGGGESGGGEERGDRDGGSDDGGGEERGDRDGGGQDGGGLGGPAVGVGAGLDWCPGDSRPDDGLMLVPTTLLYDAGQLMRGSDVLLPLVPEPHIVMSPFDAGPLGLEDGASVIVRAERGSLTARLRVRDGLTPGVVLAPEHLDWVVPPRAVLGDRPWVRVTVERDE